MIGLENYFFRNQSKSRIFVVFDYQTTELVKNCPNDFTQAYLGHLGFYQTQREHEPRTWCRLYAFNNQIH